MSLETEIKEEIIAEVQETAKEAAEPVAEAAETVAAQAVTELSEKAEAVKEEAAESMADLKDELEASLKQGPPTDDPVWARFEELLASKEAIPVKIEAVVDAAVPPERWTNFSHLLIFHGRAVCHARNPECARCVLRSLCAFGKKCKEQ